MLLNVLTGIRVEHGGHRGGNQGGSVGVRELHADQQGRNSELYSPGFYQGQAPQRAPAVTRAEVSSTICAGTAVTRRSRCRLQVGSSRDDVLINV